MTRDLPATVRRSREAAGLTRRRLAALAGVSEATVQNLELGNRHGDVRLSTLHSILAVLGVTWTVGVLQPQPPR